MYSIKRKSLKEYHSEELEFLKTTNTSLFDCYKNPSENKRYAFENAVKFLHQTFEVNSSIKVVSYNSQCFTLGCLVLLNGKHDAYVRLTRNYCYVYPIKSID